MAEPAEPATARTPDAGSGSAAEEGAADVAAEAVGIPGQQSADEAVEHTAGEGVRR
ncbi:gliding motility protein [Streptomyces sp. SID625]|nr:gliding motility protein [Streptomyces sp. SID625]